MFTSSVQKAVGGLGLALVAACSGAKTERPVVTKGTDSTSVSASGVDAARRGKSMVRLVDALPVPTTVDLAADDKPVFTAVNYKSVTPYAEIGDNLVKMQLRSGGAGLADNSETMTDGYRYTVIALPKKDGEGAQLRIVRDELVADSGKARIRVINASSGLGEIDVYEPGKREPLFDNVNLGSEAGYKDIAPMSGVLEIRGEKGVTPLRLKSTKFEAGKAYTIVVSGVGRKMDVITFDDSATS